MDNIGQGGGGGDGAFERFITSAIATILTIIFSWRLVLEMDGVESVTNARALPAPPQGQTTDEVEDDNNNDMERLDDSDKCQYNTGENDTGDDDKMAEDFTDCGSSSDGRPINGSEEGSSGRCQVGDSTPEACMIMDWRQAAGIMYSDTGSELQQTIIPGLSIQVEQHSNTEERYYSSRMTPAAEAASTDGDEESDSYHDSVDTTPNRTNSDDSDSTIENEESDIDSSESDTEKETSDSSGDYTGGAREYHLGDPLGDSSSESEYCVVFNYLEAITEEDTDDMDISDRERHVSNKKTRKHRGQGGAEGNGTDSDSADGAGMSNMAAVAVRMLGIGDADTQPGVNDKQRGNANDDSDTTLNASNCDSDNEALLSDTGSIDVTYDNAEQEAELPSSPTRYGLLNTRRPLIIGPYTDRSSKFALSERCMQPENTNQLDRCPYPEGSTIQSSDTDLSTYSDLEYSISGSTYRKSFIDEDRETGLGRPEEVSGADQGPDQPLGRSSHASLELKVNYLFEGQGRDDIGTNNIDNPSEENVQSRNGPEESSQVNIQQTIKSDHDFNDQEGLKVAESKSLKAYEQVGFEDRIKANRQSQSLSAEANEVSEQNQQASVGKGGCNEGNQNYTNKSIAHNTGKFNNDSNEERGTGPNVGTGAISKLAKLDLVNTEDSGLAFNVTDRRYKSELFVGESLSRKAGQNCISGASHTTYRALSLDNRGSNTVPARSNRPQGPNENTRADKAVEYTVDDRYSHEPNYDQRQPWTEVLLSSSPTYVDCTLSTAQEKPPAGYTFVKTTNVEKDFHIQSHSRTRGSSDIPTQDRVTQNQQDRHMSALHHPGVQDRNMSALHHSGVLPGGYKPPPRSPYAQDSGISSPCTHGPDPWLEAHQTPHSPDDQYTFVVDYPAGDDHNQLINQSPGVYYISQDPQSHRKLDLTDIYRENNEHKEAYIRDVYDRNGTKRYDPDTRTIGQVMYRNRPDGSQNFGPNNSSNLNRLSEQSASYNYKYSRPDSRGSQYNTVIPGKSGRSGNYTVGEPGVYGPRTTTQGYQPNSTTHQSDMSMPHSYHDPHVATNVRHYHNGKDTSSENRRSWHMPPEAHSWDHKTIGGPGFNYQSPKLGVHYSGYIPQSGSAASPPLRQSGGRGGSKSNEDCEDRLMHSADMQASEVCQQTNIDLMRLQLKHEGYEGYSHHPSTSSSSCTAQAISTALAKRDLENHLSDRESFHSSESSIVSAVATAQATGENPYVAVARATARAATLASANAAAGAAGLPSSAGDMEAMRHTAGDPKQDDISVVISTSCKIRNNKDTLKESTEVVDALGKGVGFTVHKAGEKDNGKHKAIQSGNTQSNYTSDPRKMTITIQGEGGPSQQGPRTVECTIPNSAHTPSDLTTIISQAVRSILATQSGTPEQKASPVLSETIDRVTRQVVRAYSSEMEDEDPSDSRQGPMYDTVRGGGSTQHVTSSRSGRGVAAESVPTSKLLSKNEVGKDERHYGSTARYIASQHAPAALPGSTPLRQPCRTDSQPHRDRTYFYVKGTGSTNSMADGDTQHPGVVDEVLMKVVADDNMQLTIEHVILSESESGSEAGTPLMRRHKYIAMETPSNQNDACTHPASMDDMMKGKRSATPAAAAVPHAARTRDYTTTASDTRHSQTNNGEGNSDKYTVRNSPVKAVDVHSVNRQDGSTDRPLRGILKGRSRLSDSESSEGVMSDVGQPQQQQQQQQQQPKQQYQAMTGHHTSPSKKPATSSTSESIANHYKSYNTAPPRDQNVNGAEGRSPSRKVGQARNVNMFGQSSNMPVGGKDIDNSVAPVRDRKPYESVLLRPLQDRKTPYHIIRDLAEGRDIDEPENKAKIDQSRSEFLKKETQRAEPVYPSPYMYDAEFEASKRHWANKTPTVGSNLVLVDIDIDNQKASVNSRERARSCEDIKKRLGSMRLKAPPSHPADKVWPSMPLIGARSHDRALNEMPSSNRGPMLSSFASVNVPMLNESVIRKVKSMSILPSQFFSDRRSYTSLAETDLDTLDTKETPLVMETDLDQLHSSKAKSMSNLATATKWRSVSIFDDERHKSMEAIPSDYNLQYSTYQPQDDTEVSDNAIEQERSSSEHELRIAESLNKLSIPEWYRSSIRRNIDTVMLKNTKPQPHHELYSSGSESSESRPESRTGRPVVIRHRVSSFTRPSPSSNSSSKEDVSFELPSAKFRQKVNVDLKPIEIKKLEQLSQPINRADPNRGSAREQYLKLKAEMNAKSASLPPRPPPKIPPKPSTFSSPVKSVHRSPAKSLTKSATKTQPQQQIPPEYLETTFDGDTDSVTTQSVNSMIMKDTYDSNSQVSADKTFVTQSYIQLKKSSGDDSSTSGYASNNTQKPASPRRSTNQTNDKLQSSGNSTSLEPTSFLGIKRKPKSQQTKIYTVGLEASNIVQDLGQTPEHSFVPLDNKVDVKSPVYDKMMTNLESTSREIQERARLISSEENIRYEYMRDNKGDGNPPPASKPNRKSFPLLIPNTVKRDGHAPWQSVKKEGKVAITMTEVSLQDKLTEAENSHSLDEVLGGLLGIPSPSSPQNEDQTGFDIDDDEDDEPDASPKARVFRLLRQAQTPRNSMNSLRSKGDEAPDSVPEDEVREEQEDLPHNSDLQSYTSFETMDKISEELIMVKCRNLKCKKTTELREARNNYKTCHNCYTYYCSRECRKAHWQRHKRTCLFSRINSSCKHVIKFVHDDDNSLEQITKLARTGYLSKGRGCVLLVFSSPEKATDFLKYGFSTLDTPPGFANIKELQNVEYFGDHLSELVDLCKSYNPELKFVIEVAIVAGEEMPTFPVPRREGPAIKKCSKLRLSNAHLPPPSMRKNEPETLILTAVPGSEFTENMEETRARQICFINLQRKLRQRGVSLRHHYPDAYKRLCAYVADNEHFTPMTIYPLDANTGKRFMCLIMPNSEPEVEWMYEPDLLDELGLSTSV